MAFFNNLGKKASDVTAKAMQKAQDLSETSKINSLISEEEKKINATYYQIGKLYVRVHGSNAESDFSEMVDKVLEGECKVNEYRKKIQEIKGKGVQHCEKCGAEVVKGAVFCSSCGVSMPKIESTLSEDTIKCENCGIMVKRGIHFCTSCGKPMNLPVTSDTSTPVTSDTSAPVMLETSTVEISEEKVAEKVCSNCEAKIESNSNFCTTCGAKL